MNHCNTCKSWDRSEALNDNDKVFASGGHCTNERICEYYPHTESSLVYSYSEGGRFWTGPLFGCVHHN